jgi:hypothetical protein
VRLDVEWGHGQRRRIESVDELDELLDRVAAEARADGCPQDVQITCGDAGTLGVVVGPDRSLLNHVRADLDPPYMVSVGDDVRAEPFVFYVAGDHYSEAAWRNTISPGAARDAVRHFAATGQLSQDVVWEEV